MKTRVFRLLLIGLIAGACDGVTSPEPLPIRLSASVNTAQEPVGNLLSIAYELVNEASFPLWVGSCDGQPLVAVEHDEGGTWVNVSAGVCPANLDMTPIAIPAGGTLEGVRVIDAIPGRYRAVAYGHRRQQERGTKVFSNIVTIGE